MKCLSYISRVFSFTHVPTLSYVGVQSSIETAACQPTNGTYRQIHLYILDSLSLRVRRVLISPCRFLVFLPCVSFISFLSPTSFFSDVTVEGLGFDSHLENLQFFTEYV
jgi:hypothetical protein